MFPARAIFRHISGSKIPCCVFILRMTDQERQGRFLAPLPSYAIATQQQEFQPRQLTPWVTSIYEAQSLAHVLNVLGRVGRTKNIELLYADRDFDRWDAPMFILGGSWKATRAFETCNPLFTFTGESFLLRSTSESFVPQSAEHDIGLLEKMTNKQQDILSGSLWDGEVQGQTQLPTLWLNGGKSLASSTEERILA